MKKHTHSWVMPWEWARIGSPIARSGESGGWLSDNKSYAIGAAIVLLIRLVYYLVHL